MKVFPCQFNRLSFESVHTSYTKSTGILSPTCSMPAGGTYQPFTAPAVMPETICRWKNINMISGGIVIITTSANSKFHCELHWLIQLNNVSCAVTFSLPGRKYSGKVKSL